MEIEDKIASCLHKIGMAGLVALFTVPLITYVIKDAKTNKNIEYNKSQLEQFANVNEESHPYVILGITDKNYYMKQ